MSHLKTILRRAKRPEGNDVPHLISIIEYINWFDDWTAEEYEEALSILRRRGSGLEPGSAEALLARHYGPRDHWKRACVRCGQVLNGNAHPVRGMGEKCSKIIGDGRVVDSGRCFGPRRNPVKLDPSRFLHVGSGGA